MIDTLAIAGYRSIRELVVPLGQLTLVTGANGAGKSNLYRGLRLLCEVARGEAVTALGAEGGLASILWAGPEQPSRAMKQGDERVQGGPRQQPVSLRLGFATGSLSYAIDFGLPIPVPGTVFSRDPQIKREAIWGTGSWRKQRSLIDRTGPLVRARDDAGCWQVIEQHLPDYDSILDRCTDPARAPETLQLREELRAWRFYDHFRCDRDAPARSAHIGVRTPVLANDGHDLAAAWRTVEEIGDADGLAEALNDAFPGASVELDISAGRFSLLFNQPGLLRPLTQAELSDGTLRYLLLLAALMTPRPPPLMVLNEPETSLHPELLPPLGRLMRRYAQQQPLWVVSHAPSLQAELMDAPGLIHLELDKELGETFAQGFTGLNEPAWSWPTR